VFVDQESGRALKAGVLGLLFGLDPAVLDGDLDTGSALCFSQGGVGGLPVRTAVEIDEGDPHRLKRCLR
jgi:hypothetical protein